MRLCAGPVVVMLIAGLCAAQAPHLVKDLNTRPVPTPSNPRPTGESFRHDGSVFLSLVGVTYFVADHPQYGTELFETKGTAATTKLVMDIQPGPGSSEPRSLATDGWRLFFSADDGRHGRELWVAEPVFSRVRMVKDINQQLASGSNPSNFAHCNGVILFQASDLGDDAELWRTDGTEQNTYRVADLNPGRATSSSPVNFTVWKDRFYFQAHDGTRQRLWRSDGTAQGTVNLGIDVDSSRGQMMEYRGDLYFAGGRPASGIELWRIDGSSLQPEMVHDLYPGPDSSGPEGFVLFRDELYFVAQGARPSGGLIGAELFRTDGVTAGAIDVYPGMRSSHPRDLVVHGTGAGSKLLFSARGTIPGTSEETGEELWVFDGQQLSTLDLNPGAGNSVPTGLTVGPGGYVYFAAWSPELSHELWCSDGTPQGTRLFKRLNAYPSPIGSDPSFISPHPSLGLVFACDDGVHGIELWQCDGTQAGTHLIADVNPLQDRTMGAQAVLRAAVGGLVYFTADADGTGRRVWSTDGTDTGTQPVAGLDRARVRSVSEIRGIGNQAFVVGEGVDANGRETGTELFVVDLRSGAVRVLDLLRGTQGSQPRDLLEFRGELYFSAVGDHNEAGPARGRELWRSDGTAAGTRMVADINPGLSGPDHRSSDPGQFFVFDNLLIFAAQHHLRGRELWQSDGTATGTAMVADLYPGPEGSHPHGFTRLGERIVFVATGERIGTELFVYSGAGQRPEAIDLRAGPDSGFPPWHMRPDRALARAGTQVFFAADGDLHRQGQHAGMELWCSDGTVAGTRLVSDIWPGAEGSDPCLLVPADEGRRVVFVARTGFLSTSTGPALFSTDGTGVTQLRPIDPGWLGERESESGRYGARDCYVRVGVYRAQAQVPGFELYLTDGTLPRTRTVISDYVQPHFTSAAPTTLVANSGLMFVTREHPRYGNEVFVLDGQATAIPIGSGCSLSPRVPTLTSTDPLVGPRVRAELRGAARSPGLLMVGMWASSPLDFGRACAIHVDPIGPQVFVPFFTDAVGRWRGDLRSTGGVPGFRYAIQAMISELTLSGTASLTNGVVLAAGDR